MSKKELQELYFELSGKKAPNFWNEDALQSKIDELKTPQPDKCVRKVRAFPTHENAEQVQRSYTTMGYKTRISEDENGNFVLFCE
jgi:hypothetical protein